MPTLHCNGIDAVSESLKKLSLDNNKELVKEMLKAGEKPVITAWQYQMASVEMMPGIYKKYYRVRRGKISSYHMKTRATFKTINKVSGSVSLKGSTFSDDIFPRGNATGRTKPTRNATIAFVLNYGKTKKACQKPTNFINATIIESSGKCVNEMNKVLHDYLVAQGLM